MFLTLRIFKRRSESLRAKKKSQNKRNDGNEIPLAIGNLGGGTMHIIEEKRGRFLVRVPLLEKKMSQGYIEKIMA